MGKIRYRIIDTPSGILDISDNNLHKVFEEQSDNSIDKHFVHEQNVPSITWNVEHNLNKFPSVSVVDSAGTIVEGKINYIDLNSVVLEFNASFTGKAYLN